MNDPKSMLNIAMNSEPWQRIGESECGMLQGIPGQELWAQMLLSFALNRKDR